MRSLEDLDRWIGGLVKRLSTRVAGEPPPKELLEIRRDVLNDVRDHIEAKGGGEYLFPYREIKVRTQHETLAADDSLDQDIRELLRRAGCPLPPDFRVTVEVAEDRLGVEYFRRPSQPKIENARPAARLKVLRGDAHPEELSIAADRINIGRSEEVYDEHGSVRRRNDLAFADAETTVSREHAYIRWDQATGKFRLYDYLSQRETALFRDGRRIAVPRGSARGVQLQSGDEIHVGNARIRFDI